jgi:hypothetical protein
MLTTMVIIILAVVFWRLWLAIGILFGGVATVIVLILITLAALSGCASRVPVLASDCEIARYVQQWETVAECKMASLKQEDAKAKREARELEWLQEERACTTKGDAWVKYHRWSNEGVCRPWSML